MFFTILIYAAIFLLAEALRPRPRVEGARPADLGSFTFPTTTEDRKIPVVWGTVKLSGPNVVWYGDFRQQPITQRTRTGLWSSSTTTIGFKYYLGVQMALCCGQVDSLRRVWIGDDEVYSTPLTSPGDFTISQPDLFGGDSLGTGGVSGTCTWYNGSASQGADPYASAFMSTPHGYRHTSYVLAKSFYFGNSTQIRPWSFEVRRIPNGLALGTPGVNGDNDANPMNVLYEILTDTDWGYGYSASTINVTNFQAAAATLLSEGQGFSFVLDTAMSLRELMAEVQRQIDGVLYIDMSTGKWNILLARGGYSIPALTQLDDSNVVEVKGFTRGTWDETINEVRIPFTDRAKDYFSTSALAQDGANAAIRGGTRSIKTERFIGVKDAVLANALAWRTLRASCFPLARATLVVNRESYAVIPGQVIAWTNEKLSIDQMPMRVITARQGTHVDGRIELDVVQDAFTHEVGSFGDPPTTGWTPQADTLVAIPSNDSVIFEAPYAFCRRDPDFPGVIDRLWCGARYQGDNAVGFDIRQRNSTGTPSGSFIDDGRVYGFLPVGDLQADITAASTSMIVDPNPDTVAEIAATLRNGAIAGEIGSGLANLLYIDGEFVAPTSFSTSSSITLSSLYRGMCDTAPAAHVAGTKVYAIVAAGAISATQIAAGNNVHVRLLPFSRSDQLLEASGTQISLTMANRARRPYPVVNLTQNGTPWATGTVSLDAGSGIDGKGITQGWRRRDWRVLDEVQGLGADAATLSADFPTANTTEHQVEVRADPSGANTLLFTTSWAAGTSQVLTRTKIIRYANGLPSRLRVKAATRHTFEGTVLSATQVPQWDFNVASAEYGSLFFLGVKNTNASTNTYTAPSTGTYTVTIGTAFPSGSVEVDVNGGGFVAVITAGNTSGTFSASAADTIVLRHMYAGPGTGETGVHIDAPSSASDAYGVFIQ